MHVFGDPDSVAVVGASNDPAKWGYWLARGALAGRERRSVWLVNRADGHVLGQETRPNVSSLPGVPELVVVCVPPAHVAAVVDESLTLGAKGFLIITAGVPEADALAARIRGAGARLIGPNSLGLVDASTDLDLAWGHFSAGNLAIVSQSGQLGSEIANLAARSGLGVSRFVSVGNQIDVNAAELLEDLVEHEQTRLVALYLESFAGGESLVRTLRRLRAAGKRTIVLATGASEASRRLAASHTGSMTSTLDLVDAACRASGAVRVNTPTELVELASYLSMASLPAGDRVAVVSDSGGQGGVAADAVAAAGLDTPEFSAGLQESIAALLPAGAAITNPIDLAGAGESDMQTYAELCELLAASGEVDSILVSGYLGCYGEDTSAIAADELAVVDRLGALVAASDVPLVVHTMSAGSTAVSRMREHGIATVEAVEQGVRALQNARHLASHPGRELDTVSPRSLGAAPGYWAARGALGRVGVALPTAALVTDVESARAAALELSAPLVLKAGWLAHKSEHGGVRLGLRNAGELVDAFIEMHARLGDGEYVVEEQDRRDDVVEVLIGARRDRDFGPTISVGAGGTEAELWKDVRTEIAPIDREVALSMLESLRSHRLLTGWRGRPAVDIGGLADLLVAVAEGICSDETIADLEVNPVRVAPGGPLAVDGLISFVDPATQTVTQTRKAH
ncbi:acetate--CoA ligase family protein [Aeromicrobium sp.]|uniref:acetate--CoA ligase family protein n=1 Tax=Aeromicrobium sp. TaxID=1871063 RepID=UPI0028A7B229|nr:acetate--CoA ligase family protein [Aeromicrobium sp.]